MAILVAAALVIGGIVFVAFGRSDDKKEKADTTTTTQVTDTTETGSTTTEPEETTTTTEPADDPVKVTHFNVGFEMPEKPMESKKDIPTDTGDPVSMEMAAVEGSHSFLMVAVYDTKGRPMDLRKGLQGAADGFTCDLAEPAKTTVGGKSGLRTTVTGCFYEEGAVMMDGDVAIIGNGDHPVLVASFHDPAESAEHDIDTVLDSIEFY